MSFFAIKKQNIFQLILKKGKIYMCLFIKQVKKDVNIFLNNKNNKINLILIIKKNLKRWFRWNPIK
ncbi:hypothetical protein PAWBP_0160 [Paulownia witches'-broom phytoplasma]|nr:hypothetical protein PAWBP_0160 [Paulownia witches'-broom phytoplasma]